MAKKKTKKLENLKKEEVPATGEAPQGGADIPKTKTLPNKNQKHKLTPEQLAQRQMEQAIRESTNPSARLKKIKKPITWKSFFLALLFIIVFSIGIIYLWGYCSVDKFDFIVFSSDMLSKLGFTEFFTNIGTTIGGWFG